MQDCLFNNLILGGKTVVVRKIIRNGQPESPDKKEFKSDIKIKSEPIDKIKLRPSCKPKVNVCFSSIFWNLIVHGIYVIYEPNYFTG